MDSGGRRITSVARALSVLEVLASRRGDLGTNEISRRTGINASTVSRLLATLADRNYVERVAESGRYRLGLRLTHLGNAVPAGSDLRGAARAHLVALAEETGETTTLSAPAEHGAVTIDFVPSGSFVRSVAALGRSSPGHATAAGKVAVAFGSATLPEGDLEAFAPQTITDVAAARSEIDTVRRQGWAQAICERERDLNALAAPVLTTRRGLIAIIGIQGPAFRFDERSVRSALPSLLRIAGQVSSELGPNH
jgi:IclR family acetate operon transcriptional repressor